LEDKKEHFAFKALFANINQISEASKLPSFWARTLRKYTAITDSNRP
jgi:hypothetical protein